MAYRFVLAAALFALTSIPSSTPPGDNRRNRAAKCPKCEGYADVDDDRSRQYCPTCKHYCSPETDASS